MTDAPAQLSLILAVAYSHSRNVNSLFIACPRMLFSEEKDWSDCDETFRYLSVIDEYADLMVVCGTCLPSEHGTSSGHDIKTVLVRFQSIE
jgi:hypothetical protein